MSDKKMQEPYEDFLTFAAITNPFFKGQDMVPPEMSQAQEDTKSSEDFKSHKMTLAGQKISGSSQRNSSQKSELDDSNHSCWIVHGGVI